MDNHDRLCLLRLQHASQTTQNPSASVVGGWSVVKQRSLLDQIIS